MRKVAAGSRRIKASQLFVVAVVSLAVGFVMRSSGSAAADSAPLTRTHYNSLDDGTEDYNYWQVQAKSANRVTYLADPIGQRGVVQRVTVQPGDTNVFGSSSQGERAEVANYNSLSGFVDGQTIVLSWSTMIGFDFASPQGDWNNFVQTHVAGGPWCAPETGRCGGQSPWELNLVGDNADLKMRLYGGGSWNDSEQLDVSVGEWFALGSLEKNRWYDFVIEVRYGCTGNGYAKVWRDGTLLVDAQDRRIGYCGDPGMYWKQGFYRRSYEKPTTLWFGDTFRWNTSSDAFANYGWSPTG